MVCRRRTHRPRLRGALTALPVLLVAVFAAGPVAANEQAAAAYGAREDVRQFAAGIAEREGLDLSWIERQLAQAQRSPAVQRLIMPAAAGVAKNWATYRTRFVEPERISAGAAFWRANEDALRRAEERWGVPPEIVVGILGVETYYGRIMGRHRTIDALATLSFDFPSGRSDRSDFFRQELEAFLVLSAREGADPQAARGSYAGAIGLPQFMPSSINRFAIDFDGDGHVDLQNSAADAIGSVAHYLAQFGWVSGMPTHYEVAVPADLVDRAVLLAPDIVPSFTPAQFSERGAVLPESARTHDGPLALVMVENGDAAPSYFAGTRNFYVVTRYNRSSYYALAVIALGEAVRYAR
jgi:membrane-bound lytic murein transglycosylase B